jgi:hypothetical protein
LFIVPFYELKGSGKSRKIRRASPGLTHNPLFAILHYRKINSDLNRQRDFSGAGMAPNNVRKLLAPQVTHFDPQLVHRLAFSCFEELGKGARSELFFTYQSRRKNGA